MVITYLIRLNESIIHSLNTSIAVVVFSCISCFAASGQTIPINEPEFFVEYIDISSGLSNNYVSKIDEDQFGMMWFASEGAVNKFDGKNFKHLKPSDRYVNLLNENIETLFIDKDEKIWVGTKSGGLSKYDPVTDRFENLNKRITEKDDITVIRISDFAQDKSGDIWVSTWGLGLYRLSSDGNELISSFLPEAIIQDIEIDKYGNVWVATSRDLFKYDPSEERLVNVNVAVGGLMEIFYDESNESLLLGAASGLYKLDIDDNSLKEYAESVRLGFQGINSINVDGKGRIWVGSWTNGLYMSNQDRDYFEKFSLTPYNTVSTNYETVLDIFIDRNDFMWIATAYGGVVKVSPRKSISYIFNSFENDVNIEDNNIQAVSIDSRGALWCGTWGRGIGYSLDGKIFEHLRGTGIDKMKISVFLELNNLMLVGTRNGLYAYNILDPKKGPEWRLFPEYKIKDIYLDSQDRLWVGTQQNGLLLFDYRKDPNLEHPIPFGSNWDQSSSLKSERISKVSEDAQGNIWIGTYYGLYLFKEPDSTFVRMDNSGSKKFPSVIVLSILPTSSNELWFGMPGGLLQASYQNGELQILNSFNSSNGLKNDFVTAMTEDVEGNIWISNASGIATVRKGTGAIINLSGNQERAYSMNINSYFNNGDRIYFGSSNGLFFFDPFHIDLLRNAPNLIFNSLKIDNEEVSVDEVINERVLLSQTMPFTNSLKISHNESIVSIGFVPKIFKDYESLTFYYRVLGLQENWINNGSSTEISFIGLNAGSYVLEVKGTRDNVNFGQVSRMNIVVLPPPWLSFWAISIYVIILIALIILINQFFVNRTKLESNLAMAKMSREKEHELNEAKLRFFTNISHELRTPLTLIISPITEILNNTKLHSGLRERLSYVEKNAQRLLVLINQILDFRKAEQGELKLKVGAGNFAKFVQEIYLSFKGYSETQGVVYEFESSTDFIEMTFDRDKMEMLVCNLLSNAFKFTSQNGVVKLSLYEDEKNCYLKVSDSGRGISQEYQDKIFNRFFQIQDADSAKVVGSGIGLSLSKKIAELHHGDIEVSSRPKQGTDFIVTLPKGANHFAESEFIQGFVSSEDISSYEEVSTQNDEEQVADEHGREKILVVDDNKDILSYIATIFKEQGYEIITAENGRVGKDLAIDEIPDLIISDIMMPEMDGIELCKHLKKDIRTSHIPIILLTARTSTVYEVDGLDTGADDYVRKPFDVDVIKARVASLLENRQHIRAYLLNKLRFETDPGIQPLNKEEKFIQDISKRVEENLENESFSIEVLADELCMSQSTLYRKIKSLTGMSIAGFMRSIRLKKAAELLITEDINMSQAAYKVGFNDYKYFKKSFKEQFGCLPSEYVEKHKAGWKG